MSKIFSTLFIMVLSFSLLMAMPAVGGADNSNDAATLTITATGEMQEYELAIASTAGGSVTTPGEETFTFDEGTVVDLVAEPLEHYLFVNWTGDVDAIADINAAATTVTMHGDYSIVASFDSLPESPPPQPQSFPWWWIVVAVVAVLLAGYFLRWRRR